MKILIFLTIFCIVNAAITISQNSEPLKLNAKDFEAQVVQAAELLSADKLNDARSILEPLLKAYPNNVDINQLYATLWLKSGDQPKLAIEYYEKAIRLPGDKNPAIYSNYLEALRADGRHEDARKIGLELLEKKMIPFSSLTCTFYLNLGLIEKSFLNLQNAYDLLNTAIQCDRTSLTAWSNLAEVLVQAGMFPDAEKVAREAIDIFPKEDFYLYYILGTALHHQKKLNGALNAYLIAESLNDKHLITKANIAAAFQGLGRAVDALYYYQQIIPLMPNDGGVRNNYGALLGTMNRKDEEIYWLEEALKLDPTMEHAMINLAGHYQDEGLLQKAGHYLLMAENNTMDRTLLRLRYALMLSPVPFSYRQVLNERMRIIHNLRVILQSPPKALAELDTTLDRIHFYLSYHGFNDRNFQQGIGEIYHLHIKDINYTKPSLLLSAPLMSSNSVYNSVQDFLRFEKRTQKEVKSLTTTKRKSRIGFISKFFGIFEPHGMLLDGVMKYLPKDEFEVICLLIARTDLKPPAPTVIESCNEVYEISLVFQHAMNIINSIPVDVLIFADVVSEPINHFLAFNRIAPIQIAFWGNPITSGSNKIDYFMSADIMEHPHRTLMPIRDDPYSEQVILLDGQGIWYFQPTDPKVELEKANISHLVGPVQEFTRKDFNLSDDDFIFLLPQSVFKIHPLYDLVLSEILLRNQSVHLVVTGGRQHRWTKIYLLRLIQAIGKENIHRLHIIERVSSESFYNLIKLSNVILHPFPFDGSRTSADSLIVNIPYVTLPTEYLRGRMGYAFLRTMNISELVASNIEEYIEIALKLASDQDFYQDMKIRIAKNLPLIWEDMHYPYQWTHFLQRILGHLTYHNYFSFLQKIPSIDPYLELAKSKQREMNSYAFDEMLKKTGKLQRMKEWQLNENFQANLEMYSVDVNQWPKLFEFWHQHNKIAQFHNISFESRMIPESLENQWINENITLPQEYLNMIKKIPKKPKTSNATTTATTSSPSLIAEATPSAAQSSSDEKAKIVPKAISIENEKKNVAEEKPKKEGISIFQTTSSSIPSVLPKNDNILQATKPSLAEPQQLKKAQDEKIPAPPNMPSEFIFQFNRYSELLEEFYGLFKQHQFSEAILVGKDLLTFLSTAQRQAHMQHPLIEQKMYDRDYPMILLDIGLLYYLTGEYIQSFHYCTQVHQLFHPLPNQKPASHHNYKVADSYQESSLIYSCLGMNALYLPLNMTLPTLSSSSSSSASGDATEREILEKIFYLEKAYQLIDEEEKENSLKLDLRSKQNVKPRLHSPFFKITKTSIESSLIQLFNHFQRYDLCLSYIRSPSFGSPASYSPASSSSSSSASSSSSKNYFPLGPIEYESGYVILFSMVRWNETYSIQFLQTLEDILIDNKLFYYHPSMALDRPYHSLYSQILFLQDHKEHILNPLMNCFVKNPAHRSLVENIQNNLYAIITQVNLHRLKIAAEEKAKRSASSSSSSSSPQKMEGKRGLALVTQYYLNRKDPLIQQDLDDALIKNLMNPFIDEIYLLTEENITNLNRFPNLSKLRQMTIGSRLTFQQAFQFANEYLPGRIVMLANADIYFDYTLETFYEKLLDEMNATATVYQIKDFPQQTLVTLLKWTSNDNRTSIGLDLRTDSQDTWIFQPPVPQPLIEASNFALGLPRCDNRIIELFYQNHYTIANAPFHIHSIEIQRDSRRMKSYENNDNSQSNYVNSLYGMKNAVIGDGRNVFLSDYLNL